jgi:hypothetical protein
MAGGSVRQWVLIAVCYLLFLEGLSWVTSAGPGPCVVYPEQHSGAGQNDNQKSCATFFDGSLILLGRLNHFIERHDKSIVATFTVVLAISTIGLWLATKRLWEAGERQIKTTRSVAAVQARHTQRQLKHAEETAERQLRAYIGIEEGHVVLLDAVPSEEVGKIGKILLRTPKPTMQVQLRFRNSGQTPAYDFTGWLSAAVDDTGANPFDRVSEGRGKTLIGPGGFTHFRTDMTMPDESLLPGVLDRKKTIYAWGKVTYRDAFKVTRYFEFQLTATGPASQIRVQDEPILGWGMIPTKKGYDAN